MLTACKYLITIFAKALGRDTEQSVDDDVLGTFLIIFDCIVIVGGMFCVVAIVCMLRRDIHNLKTSGKIDSDYDEDAEYLIQQIKKMSKTQNRRSSVVLERAHAMLRSNSNSTLVVPQSSRWSVVTKDVNKTLIHDYRTIANLEAHAEHHHDLAMSVLKTREDDAKERVQVRLRKRGLKATKSLKDRMQDHANLTHVMPAKPKPKDTIPSEKMKMISGTTKVKEMNVSSVSPSPSLVATRTSRPNQEVESIKKAMREIIKTPKNLMMTIQKLDTDKSGGLMLKEFIKIARAALKRTHAKVSKASFKVAWKSITQHTVDQHKEVSPAALQKWLFAEMMLKN